MAEINTRLMTKPIDGEPGPSEHVVLAIEELPASRAKRGAAAAVRAGRRRAWGLLAGEPALSVCAPQAWTTADGLAELLLAAQSGRRALTVWLGRGWPDLVMSGLCELIERGRYVWRHCVIDGARTVLRGRLDNMPVNVTSCGCYTGGTWDGWRDLFTDEAVGGLLAGLGDDSGAVAAELAGIDRVPVMTALVCLLGTHALRAGPIRLSAGAQGRGVWRSWLGPRLEVQAERPCRANRQQGRAAGQVVAPLPHRPPAARAAERHCCYGLYREQFYRGHVGGPVAVWDIRQAYLWALVSQDLPTAYLRRLDVPGCDELRAALDRSEAVALVEIDSPADPYPVRRPGPPARAVGHYWTWLCGLELMRALALGHVRNVEVAWVWAVKGQSEKTALARLALADGMTAGGQALLVPYWRSLYSALVGSFAQWAHAWEDCAHPPGPAPWSAWIGTHRRTGEIVRYRSIAGRVQRRVDGGDAPGAVPILYATVTGAVRAALDKIRGEAPAGSVVAATADALWVTGAGDEYLRRYSDSRTFPLPEMRRKELWHDLWLDGRGRAVGRIGDKYYPLLTGVPSWSEVGADGTSRWMTYAPWSGGGPTAADSPVGTGAATFDARKVTRENDRPLTAARPWHVLTGGVLPEALLLPVVRRPKGGDDDA